MMAFTIPESNINWDTKLADPESSTKAEVISVTKAMTFLLSTPYQRPIIL